MSDLRETEQQLAQKQQQSAEVASQIASIDEKIEYLKTLKSQLKSYKEGVEDGFKVACQNFVKFEENYKGENASKTLRIASDWGNAMEIYSSNISNGMTAVDNMIFNLGEEKRGLQGTQNALTSAINYFMLSITRAGN